MSGGCRGFDSGVNDDEVFMIGSGTDSIVAISVVNGGCHEMRSEVEDSIGRADSWKAGDISKAKYGLKSGMGRARDADSLDQARGNYCMADTYSLDRACGALGVIST